MSRIDLFMDQDDETEEAADKKEVNGKLDPDALVDVLAWINMKNTQILIYK